jgi:hypothetical protein
MDNTLVGRKAPDGARITEHDKSDGLDIIRDENGNAWSRYSTDSYPPNRCWRLINLYGDPADGTFDRNW